MKIKKDAHLVTITQSELARVLNVTQPYIAKLIHKGVVIRDKKDSVGGVMLVESLRNFDMMLNRETTSGEEETEIPDYHAERALHEAADRRLAELKLAQQQGSLYDAKDVEMAVTEMLTVCRTRLQGIPSKLAAKFDGIVRDKVYQEAVLEVEGCIEELHGYRGTGNETGT